MLQLPKCYIYCCVWRPSFCSPSLPGKPWSCLWLCWNKRVSVQAWKSACVDRTAGLGPWLSGQIEKSLFRRLPVIWNQSGALLRSGITIFRKCFIEIYRSVLVAMVFSYKSFYWASFLPRNSVKFLKFLQS